MTCETYLPRIGGAEIHVKNLFERLLRNGHEVSLLTNERGPEMLGVQREDAPAALQRTADRP